MVKLIATGVKIVSTVVNSGGESEYRTSDERGAPDYRIDGPHHGKDWHVQDKDGNNLREDETFGPVGDAVGGVVQVAMLVGWLGPKSGLEVVASEGQRFDNGSYMVGAELKNEFKYD